MNIEILNDFDETKIYSAFDNIIIEFGLDTAPTSPIDFAEVIGLGFPVDLSPNPKGNFYFNFKLFSKSYITKGNLQDKISYDVDILNADSFGKEDPDFMQGKNITIKVVLEDATEITKNFILKYYRGVQDLERFNHYLFVAQNDVIDYTATSIYYWRGYPLDIGVFSKGLGTIGLILNNDISAAGNESTEILTYQLIDNYQFTRVILTNGVDNIRSTNGTDLMQLINSISVKDYDQADFAVKIFNVVRMPECEGHYLKWLNRSGDYSYFLFSNKYEESIDASSIGSINNDFKNKEYNPSPSLSKGKTSNREMTLFKSKVDEKMRYFLSDLIDSPKVYYYTGKKDTKASQYNWIEVNVTDNNFEMERPKENTWNYFLQIEFTKYKNQTI